ncbi:MAG: N-acetyl-gamma-glutamyl-phosphate reductase [Ardenticatenaceae bacterium]|nr:N-acetyl-gamma-glutamyl-phosphate reductase [Ardenticatenaceae bacterium]
MIKAGIFGATGYAGIELVELLQKHPHVDVVFVTSESSAGQPLNAIHPQGPAWTLIKSEDAPLDEVDIVFLCLPHAASAATAVRAREHGCRVIDLSADFRLNNLEKYEEWYKVDHPKPEWLADAVYGLSEHARTDMREADIVACPGCYPTSILLPLQPLVAAGAVAPGATVIADAKSGVSGGGRKAKLMYHFVEVADNMTPYGLGQNHRHWVEMQEKLTLWGNGSTPNLIFSPHLIAIPRGILSTIYVPMADGWDLEQVQAVFTAAYEKEPFIHLLPPGQHATIAHVVRTNRCAIGLTISAGSTLIVTSAIDNITKGSSGQAVQNFNIMYGFEETTALV